VRGIKGRTLKFFQKYKERLIKKEKIKNAVECEKTTEEQNEKGNPFQSIDDEFTYLLRPMHVIVEEPVQE